MSNNGISFIYRHKLHSLPNFEEYPQTTNFFFFLRQMHAKRNVGAKSCLELSFFKLIFMERKNRLCLGQVLGRWTFMGGITICLHLHIPVTFILSYLSTNLPPPPPPSSHTHTHTHTHTILQTQKTP